jgi:hypothetical protein
MWRGGGRSSISVAAPFVWRCLTGPAVAPFPHPAHRTGAGWFQAFGRFAAAAAIGLLGVTLIALARPLLDIHSGLLAGAGAVFVAALRGVHPLILIGGSALLGAASALISG